MPKDILQILPYDFAHTGGVEKYGEILQEIFPEQMRTLAWWRDFAIFEPVFGCSVPKFWEKSFWQMCKNIQKNPPKIIVSHIRFSPVALMAFWLSKRNNARYIHIEHGTSPLIHKNIFIEKVAKIIDLTIGKFILKNADYVVCVSRAGEKWVKNSFHRKVNISTIYRGFEQKNIQKSKNFPKKIGFAGRLVPLKNLDMLLFSLKNLEHLPWQLLIAGDGEMRWNWEKLAEKLQISHRVIFLWNQSHQRIWENFYPKIDIFVNPSKQEGLPTTVVEALLSGAAVLATDVGGTHEIPGITLCEPTVNSITHHLKNLILKENSEKIPENFPFQKETMKKHFEKIF